MNYYVYVWIDPKTLVPFYVGKGKNQRAYAPHLNQRAYNKYKKLIASGFDPTQIVKFINLNLGEDEALKQEIELIQKYKRLEEGGVLYNYLLKNFPCHKKLIDPDLLQKVINEYTTTTLSAREIGKKYGIHETTCLRWLKQHNIPVYSKGNRRNISDDMGNQILVHFNNGLCPIEIARQLNITLAIILRFLRKNNFKTNSKVENRKKKTDNKENIDKIISMYQSRCSIQKIANEIKTSTTHIRRILIDNNINIRRNKWEV